jgi:hypothetical protein
MYNVFAPYVNLMNANIKALSRYVNAQQVTQLAKDSAGESRKIVQESISMIADSNAYSELTKAIIDNYARFTNEWLQNTFGIVSQGQQFMNRQVEEGQRRLSVAAELSRRTAETALQSGKAAGEEVSRKRRIK